MTVTPVQTRRGFSGKFLTAVAVVFAAQAGLVFCLSDRPVAVPQAAVGAPAFRLGDPRPAEFAALEDPTLFVLPHARGFSGEAWMKTTKREFRTGNWSDHEPLRWLTPSNEQPGGEFARFVQNNPAAPFQNITMPEPNFTYPMIPPAANVPHPSLLRIEGELAGRHPLNKPELQSWPGSEPLINSVVQVLVDPQGCVFSAVLLTPSGSKSADQQNADQQAVRVAQSTRFESIEPAGPDRATRVQPKLTLGAMVFEWQTLPATNGAAIVP